MRKTIILKTCAGRALRIAAGIAVLVLLMAGGAGAAATGVAADDWSMRGHDASHSGTSSEVVSTPNDLLWKYATGGYVSSSPVVSGGMVYVGSVDKNVYALDASTGALKWNYTTGGAVYSSPAVSGGMVYSGDSNVYAFGTAALRITATPTTVTAGLPTDVTFIVTSAGYSVSGAAVTLTGAATGSGTTDASGKVTLTVNAASAGRITATASKTGYRSGTTTVTATGLILSMTANPTLIPVGTPTSVTFTVTDNGGAVVSAAVTLTGVATGSGTTDANGKVTIIVNAARAGRITATASKTGYRSGINTVIAKEILSVTANPTTITVGIPTSVIFNVTDGGVAVSGATVTLSDNATGSGTTAANGSVTISVNATAAGTITTTASKWTISGSTTITATGATVTATPTSTPAGLNKSATLTSTPTPTPTPAASPPAVMSTTTASPTIVTLQGKLTDSAGAPVQTGSMNVTIKDSSGAQVWQETFEDVIDSGVFNIPLGAIQELRLVPNRIYSMEVAIDADSRKFSTVDVTFGDNSPAGDVIKFKA